MTHANALHDWHEFYLLLGTAAAALLALLFVAVSIGVGFFTEKNAAPTRTYISPIVVHFTAVLFVAAAAIAPLETPSVLAALLAATGVVGIAVGTVTTVHIFADGGIDIAPIDHFAYGMIPALAYAAIFAAGVLLAMEWTFAPHLLGAATMALLVINIRNAWDLVLTVVRQQGRREKTKARRR